jgi:hypothetical protein
MSPSPLGRILTALVISLLAGTAAGGQQRLLAGKTAEQFYLEYRATLLKAKAMDALLPYLSTEARSMLGANTPEENKSVLQLQQTARGTTTKVLKTTETTNGVSLSVEGANGAHQKITWQVDVVNEKGAWKIRSESFPMSPEQ